MIDYDLKKIRHEARYHLEVQLLALGERLHGIHHSVMLDPALKHLRRPRQSLSLPRANPCAR